MVELGRSQDKLTNDEGYILLSYLEILIIMPHGSLNHAELFKNPSTSMIPS